MLDRKAVQTIVFLLLLLLASVTDLKKRIVPDLLCMLIALTAAISFRPEQLWGIFSALPFLLAAVFCGGMGGGDIKLMAVCGLILGWPRVAAAGFLSVVTGGCYAIWLLATRRAGRSDHFAFGPFLAVGVVLSLLYGDQLLAWYLGFLR